MTELKDSERLTLANTDKAIPMTAMPTLDKVDGEEAEQKSEIAAGVSKVEAFNRVLYQSGKSTYHLSRPGLNVV